MDYVKFIFSCILSPINGLLSFGKNMRTKEITDLEKEEQQETAKVNVTKPPLA